MAERSKRVAGKAASGLDQVRALAHPLRLKLIELFAWGPLTAKQAAEKLGQPPTRLYHHVATLERAGLLRLKETRAVRGATEKYFELTKVPLVSSRESGALLRQSTARDREAIGFTVFDQARNELLKTLAAGENLGKRPLMAVRLVAWLSPDEAERVHRDLIGVLRRLRREKEKRRARRRAAGLPRRRKGRRYSVTISMVPTMDEPNET